MASIGGSLLAVWAVSNLMAFSFSPSVVAVLSATICSAAVAVSWQRKVDEHGKAAQR
jgi:hypothetical protein